MILVGIVGLGCFLASCAPAATATRTVSPVAAEQIPQVDLTGYDAQASCATLKLSGYGDIELTRVGVFPKTDSWYHVGEDPYRLTCPGFTVQRTKNNLTTIVGLSPVQINSIFRGDSARGIPYFWNIGDYSVVDLSQPGLLTVKNYRDGAQLRQDAVIAVRQGIEPLQQFIYKGQFTPIKYDPSRPLEIYRPDGNSSSRDSWSQVIWDANTSTFSFSPNVPMPK